MALWIKAVLSAYNQEQRRFQAASQLARPRDREDPRKRKIRESFFVRPRFVSPHFLSAIERLGGALALRVALPGARLKAACVKRNGAAPPGPDR